MYLVASVRLSVYPSASTLTAERQDKRSNGSAMRALTDGQTDGRTLPSTLSSSFAVDYLHKPPDYTMVIAIQTVQPLKLERKQIGQTGRHYQSPNLLSPCFTKSSWSIKKTFSSRYMHTE